MKKTYFLLLALIAFSGYAQFNETAPWMVELRENISATEMEQRKQNPQPFTFYEVQEAFNKYWETHDHTVKGSGYKPFKRWEYFVENELDANGYVPTSIDKYDAWESKKQFQNVAKTVLADESNWQPVGPFTTVGTGSWSTGQARVNVVMIDPNNVANGTDNWYVGTPAGGIWKSTNAGSTWTPLTDQLPQIGVSGIAIDYNDSDVIYIATGDDDAGDSTSVGVWKSTDGGSTWNPTGLNPANSPSSMNDIYMHPTNANILWVATNNGIYKTTNAGVNWTQTQSGNFNDIKLNPGNPDIIYAATANRFYKSTDGGDSFGVVTTGLPFSSGRLVIDVTPDNSNYVYLFRENAGTVSVYRSTNEGTSFATRTSAITGFDAGQSWYDFAMGVSDTNAEQIYVGCLNIWRSNNGGTNFTQLNNWNAPNAAAYTHADIHFIRAYDGKIFTGTDGGVYSTDDQGTSFENHTFGVMASQLYKIAISQTNPNKMVGGLQDNGGHAFNSNTGQSNNYYGADGMDTAVDPTNDNIFYGFIQSGGGPYISTDAGATLSGSVAAPESGNWVTPMAINSTGKVYGGYTKLFRLDGTTWVELANLGGSLCDHLEIAPSDDTVMYAAVNNVLKRSTNSGVSFTDIETFTSNIKGIGVHQTDPNTVWITTSGGSKGVFKSTNALGGATFNNITANLPTTGLGEYFNDIVHQANHTDNPVYLATGLGVYRLDDTSVNWEPFMINLPNTNITDLEISVSNESVTAATYGRGVWRSPIPIQLIPNDIRLIEINNPLDNGGIECGAINPQITVKNNGLNVINTIDINYTVDGVPAMFNWTGSIASTVTEVIALPTLTLSRAAHTLAVETIITGDGNATNNNATTTFYANDSGTVNVVNDFETVSDQLIADSLWEQGVPSDALLNTATSGTQVYGTDLNANHPNSVKAHLVSQCYDLTQIADPVLRFDMAFDLENNWDIGYVEYSLDQGSNWNVLGTKNSTPLWYNSDRTNASSGLANDCQNCPGAQWTGEGENAHASGGTNATMREYAYSFSVNAANGETDLTGETNIIFRIVFHADGAVNEEGIILDDFVITGTPLSIDEINYDIANIIVYPNPSNGIFNIQMPKSLSNTSLQVLDITGKVVFKDVIQKNSDKHQLNLSSLATGIYMLNISNDIQKVTQKIIIK